MQVILHIGAHKTGTSLVQKFFRDSPELTASMNLACIERDETDQLIGWGDRLIQEPELLRSRLETELANGPAALLLSHENTLGQPFSPDRPGLYPDAPVMAEALATLCAELEPYVVFYIRALPDFVESYYLQTIHEGASHGFEEWYRGLDPGSFKWTPTVEALDAAFGADRVILGDFADIAHGQNEFLRRFIARVGLPMPAEVRYAPVRNPSISDRGLRIALEINRHLRNTEERRVTRKFLQRHFSNRRGRRAAPMPDQVRQSLAEQAAAEERALAARAAAALDGPAPAAPAPRSGTWPFPDAPDHAAAAASYRSPLLAPKRLVQRLRGG